MKKVLQRFSVTPPVCRTIYMQILTTFTIGAFTTTIVISGAEAAADMSFYPNAEATKPLAVGSMIPSATIRTVTGDSVDLADLVKQTGALLVFYRGGWWPYCSTQLGELRKVEPELSKLGYKIIALSPDRAEAMTQSLEVKDLGYDLYSDSTLAAARALGIAFQMSPKEVEEYREYGIDLEKTSGEKHYGLPVPSVFLVKAGGQILWVSSNPDYEVRPENEELLAAARRANGATAK